MEDEQEIAYINDGLDPDQRHVTTHPIEFSTAQRSLLPNEAVLEYVLADPASFCLAFDQGNSVIVKLPAGRTQINHLVAAYLTKIADGKDNVQDARKLFSLLLAPVPDSLRPQRLIIVPDVHWTIYHSRLFKAHPAAIWSDLTLSAIRFRSRY